MKASDKRQATPRSVPLPSKKQKGTLEKLTTILALLVIGVGLILVSASLLPSVASFFNDKKEEEGLVKVQKEMSEYLTGRYKEDFSVAKPERNGQMLGDSERWKATAHPLNDSGIEFTVNATYYSDNADFIDDYTAAVWTKKQNAAILQEARHVYQDMKFIDISAKVSVSGERLSNTLATDSLSYEQAVREYPDDVNYKITVRSKMSINRT